MRGPKFRCATFGPAITALDVLMIAPENDIDDRIHVWNIMQMVWMDVDTKGELEFIVKKCASSKYSISELGEIYWNEVYPAVGSNLKFGNFLPEWTGFNNQYLSELVLRKNIYGKRKPIALFHPYSWYWWRQIKKRIMKARNENT